jgi:hypothetical protein
MKGPDFTPDLSDKDLDAKGSPALATASVAGPGNFRDGAALAVLLSVPLDFSALASVVLPCLLAFLQAQRSDL